MRHIFAFLLVIKLEYVNCDRSVTVKNEFFTAFFWYLGKYQILKMVPSLCPGL